MPVRELRSRWCRITIVAWRHPRKVCCPPSWTDIKTDALTMLSTRNQHIAWGVTNVGADVMDLYLLDEQERNGVKGYWRNGTWEPFTYRNETIKVAGKGRHRNVFQVLI